MSAEGQDTLPCPDVGGKSNNVSRVPSYSVIPNSHSLEDGEIVEGYFSDGLVDSQPPSQQSSDQSPLHVSNRVEASTPSSSPGEPVGGLTPNPAIEPLTTEDLDRAKSLVLDLLGWGVTPEYLVEYGLSPGAIYKIFTDLRLRLPRNLDVSLPPTLHHGAR